MSDLRAIVYVSSATRALSQAEIDRLLYSARARNQTEGLGGLLLYCDGNFMQYIEGPRDPLLRVYGLITADPMHSGIVEIFNAPIDAREFEDWSMAYGVSQAQDMALLSRATWSGAAETAASASTPGRLLLRNFWRRQQPGGV